MQTYKRNQVEEAVGAALDRSDAEAASELRIRIKRLLETDRALGRGPHAGDLRRRYAFYSGESPGSGLEVWFSAYEAFALLVGLLLMQHRWPQGTAVRLMREARPTLEPEHVRILGQDPKELFDPVQIEKQAAPGMMAVDTNDPVFLAIVTVGRSEAAKAEGAPHVVRVCRGETDLMRFMRQNAPPGMSMTSIEVARLAHILANHLTKTEPKRRGRTSR
jgi:hypothetical protein